MLHPAPNIFLKDKNKIKFSLNLKKSKQNELNFNTNYFGKNNPDSIFLPYYIYPRLYNNDYTSLKVFKKNEKHIKIFFFRIN